MTTQTYRVLGYGRSKTDENRPWMAAFQVCDVTASSEETAIEEAKQTTIFSGTIRVIPLTAKDLLEQVRDQQAENEAADEMMARMSGFTTGKEL